MMVIIIPTLIYYRLSFNISSIGRTVVDPFRLRLQDLECIAWHCRFNIIRRLLLAAAENFSVPAVVLLLALCVFLITAATTKQCSRWLIDLLTVDVIAATSASRQLRLAVHDSVARTDSRVSQAVVSADRLCTGDLSQHRQNLSACIQLCQGECCCGASALSSASLLCTVDLCIICVCIEHDDIFLIQPVQRKTDKKLYLAFIWHYYICKANEDDAPLPHTH